MKQITDTLLKITVAAPSNEVSEKFLQGMANRMSMSYFKYGPVATAFGSKAVNAVQTLVFKLVAYAGVQAVRDALVKAESSLKPSDQNTGNVEKLMDVANYAMIEFMFPQHEAAAFTPTDSDGTAKRVWNTGEVTSRSHRPADVYSNKPSGD